MTAQDLAKLGERSPKGSAWTCGGYMSSARGTAWFRRDGVTVISSLWTDVELPDGSGIGPQWHVSISYRQRRPTDRQVASVLRDFGFIGAEEDNHHPGIARQFWRPVDRSHRVECECKTTEDLIVEPDGFRWTNPKPETGEGCRGCELQGLTGRACPIHALTDAQASD